MGHSAGGAFLVRWLGENGKKVKKLILVAPWKIPSKEFSDGENEMYNFEINGCVSNNISEILIFSSDEEHIDQKRSVEIFHNALRGELIKLKDKGHYDFNDVGTKKFPELLEKILE